MLSFYRQYRPQTSLELDLTKVRDFFSHILASGKFSHAYLFTGPRGSGKTSSARIIAKILNCNKNQKTLEKGQGKLVEPDNTCRMCSGINAGSSLSVIELDAASNRGIDDIRSLREKISLAPAEGSYVVYIIDEVHMLTSEAFNALLKTLEEPPSHAIFILATTEAHKVPDTITSRCTELVFEKATKEEITRSLKRVIKGEKLTIADKSLDLLASSVDGSFRDAVKLLEQLASMGKKISHLSVENIIDQVKTTSADKFITNLLSKDTKALLDQLSALSNEGANLTAFSKQVLQLLRHKLIQILTSQKPDQDQITTYIGIIESLSQAQAQLKTTPIPSLPLEIMVAQHCLADSKEITVSKKVDVKITTPPKVKPKEETSPPSEPKKFVPTGDPVSLAVINNRWSDVLTAVKPFNHSLEALLRATRPIDRQKNQITIEVFYKFHKEQLEQSRHRSQIESVMTKIFNFPVTLDFILGKPNPVKEDKKVENISGRVEDEELAQAAEEIFGD